MSKVMMNKKMQVNGVIVAENGVFSWMFVAAVSLLLIMAPFFRGLYFRENYIPFLIAIICIFIVMIVYDLLLKHNTVTLDLPSISLLLLPIAFSLSFFNSVNMKTAFDAIIKYFSYFMLYYIISMLNDGKIKTKLIYGTVLFSLFLVSITGMLTMSGYLNIKGVTEYNRLYGLYQYPNTTGAMLGAGILMCVGILSSVGNKMTRMLVQVLLTTLFIGFVMTLSLGAFLVFAIMALAYFILSDWNNKLNHISTYFITLLSSAPALLTYFSGNMSKSFILAYLISMVFGIILQGALTYIDKKYRAGISERKTKILVIAIVALAIIAVVSAIIIPGVIPQPIVKKIWNEELKIGNANDRLTFTKDATKMLVDNLPLGAGGGAWQDLYFKYQSYAYSSTEVHNFYAQLALESGIVGITAVAGILFLLAKRFYMTYKRNKNDVHIPIFIAIFMILGHAVLDFDLSLAAPMFLTIVLIGMTSNSDASGETKAIKSKYTAYVFLLIGIATLVFSSSMYIGIVNGNKGAQLISKDLDKAAALYEKAMSQDRFNAASRIDYAQIMYNKAEATKDIKYIDKMNIALEEIEKYEPYNWKYKTTIISLLISTGKIEQGLEMTDNMVKLKPLDVNAYVIKAQISLQLADYYYKNQKYEEATKYLDRIIATKEELQTAATKSIKPLEDIEKLDVLVEQAKSLKSSIANKQ